MGLLLGAGGDGVPAAGTQRSAGPGWPLVRGAATAQGAMLGGWGRRSVSRGQRPSHPPSVEPALGWLRPATAAPRAQAGGKDDASGSPISLYKRTHTSKNKDAGHQPTPQRPGSQAPGLVFSPPCSQSPVTPRGSFWDLHQRYSISFKCRSPQPRPTRTSTWPQHSTPTLAASRILFSPSLSPRQAPNSIPDPSDNTIFYSQFSSPNNFF